MTETKRVAIVGAGVAGLSTAWILKNGKWKRGLEKDQQTLDVTLFEKEDRLGGHVWTVRHTDENTEASVDIDLGFQVFNLTNYGNLVAMFDALKVESQPSDMSFSYSKQLKGESTVEWSSNNGIFGIFTNFFRDIWNRDKRDLARDLVRFEKDAERILDGGTSEEMTVERWLEENQYTEAFAQHYLYPMCSAVWSSPKEQVEMFSIKWLARFILNHHLHKVTSSQRPIWRVVKNGSDTYVKAIEKSLLEESPSQPGAEAEAEAEAEVKTRIKLSTDVFKIEYNREKEVYVLHYFDEERNRLAQEFDSLVLAVHSDVALRMLFSDDDDDDVENQSSLPLKEFKSVLEKIPFRENKVLLHKDSKWMPNNKVHWTSWNLLQEDQSAESSSTVCISYWANILSSLPEACNDYFVTLNPWKQPDSGKVLLETSLAHPQFSVDAFKAQQRLRSINGQHGLYLCGAWCEYGFHEDGVRSAVDVCDRLGVITPWHQEEREKYVNMPEKWSPIHKQLSPLDPTVSYRQSFYIFLFDTYMKRCIRKGFVRIILPSGHEMEYGDPNAEEWMHTHVLGRREGKECICRKSFKLRCKMQIADVNFFEAIVLREDIGMGESFFQDKWKVDDLLVLLTILSRNLNDLSATTNKWVLGVMNFFSSKIQYAKWLFRANTLFNTRKNIGEHYDAGNAMYRLFLDERMVYSSAIYSPNSKVGETSDVLTWDSLETVQLRKLREIASRCGIEKDQEVLEIGCGWGAMAIMLAKEYKCRVTGITLSTEQLEECNIRARECGVSDKCTFLLCDYRAIPALGKLFDRVISVEMIEAVGHEYFDAYFGTISKWLKPDGQATIQAISYPDHRYNDSLYHSDFIKAHIFPGGHLPCMEIMTKFATLNGLHLSDFTEIGKSYAITLMKWRENWISKHKEIRALGYDEEFYKKYIFYFAYCEAGFNEGLLLNYILTFKKGNE